MITSKHKEVFDLLYDRTRSGELIWKESVEKGKYTVSFTSYSLELSAYMHDEAPDDADPIFKIVLRNESGDVVESFDDSDIGGAIQHDPLRRAFYQKTKELFAMAQRAALGADKAIDAVLKELKDDIPF